MGSAPGSGGAQVGARQGGRGGGVAWSSSVWTSSHSTSGLSFLAPSFQTFCQVRVRSVWSVRSSSCVSRQQSRAEWMRSPAEWARPQVRDARAAEPVQLLSAAAARLMSTKRVAVFVVHLHADPAWFPSRGCGASPSGILGRGIVCRTIGPLQGRGRARSGRCDGRCLAVAAGPCVWLVARLYMLVVDEEVIVRAAVVGCLLCLLCLHLDAVL